MNCLILALAVQPVSIPLQPSKVDYISGLFSSDQKRVVIETGPSGSGELKPTFPMSSSDFASLFPSSAFVIRYREQGGVFVYDRTLPELSQRLNAVALLKDLNRQSKPTEVFQLSSLSDEGCRGAIDLIKLVQPYRGIPDDELSQVHGIIDVQIFLQFVNRPDLRGVDMSLRHPDIEEVKKQQAKLAERPVPQREPTEEDIAKAAIPVDTVVRHYGGRSADFAPRIKDIGDEMTRLLGELRTETYSAYEAMADRFLTLAFGTESKVTMRSAIRWNTLPSRMRETCKRSLAAEWKRHGFSAIEDAEAFIDSNPEVRAMPRVIFYWSNGGKMRVGIEVYGG